MVPELRLFVADAKGKPRRVFDFDDGHLISNLNSDGSALTGLALSPSRRRRTAPQITLIPLSPKGVDAARRRALLEWISFKAFSAAQPRCMASAARK